LIRRYERPANSLKAVAHPVRLAVLKAFSEGHTSPQEAFIALSRTDAAINLAVVSYHVTLLKEAGMVELARTEKVRGATKHVYRVTKRGKLMLRLVDDLCDDDPLCED
jgi:DNA-binding transcriptional ArsR family regulator